MKLTELPAPTVSEADISVSGCVVYTSFGSLGDGSTRVETAPLVLPSPDRFMHIVVQWNHLRDSLSRA